MLALMRGRYDIVNFVKNIQCLPCNDMSEEKIKKFKEEFQHLPLKKGDWICPCDHRPFALTFRCNFSRCLQVPGEACWPQFNQGVWECSSSVDFFHESQLGLKVNNA